MLQMAQGFPQLHGYELLSVDKKWYWEKTAWVEESPFTFPLSTAVALSHCCFFGTRGIFHQWLQGWAFHDTRVTGVRLCCPKSHSTCISLPILSRQLGTFLMKSMQGMLY